MCDSKVDLDLLLRQRHIDEKAGQMAQHAVIQWIVEYRYCGIFFLLILGIIGLPVPDEWLLVISGYLAFKNILGLVPTLCIAAAGSVCGLTASYGLGRGSRNLLIHKYGRWFALDDAKAVRAQRWFLSLGRWVFIIGPFIPGMRNLVGYLAGASRLRMNIFMRFAYLGGTLSSTTFVTFGYLVGSHVKPNFSTFPLIVTVLAVAFALSGIPLRMASQIRGKWIAPRAKVN